MDVTINNFEEQLNSVIVGRGRGYYQYGKVGNIRYDDINKSFQTTVSGSKLYDLTIVIDNSNILKMDCSCPSNKVCKHITATLFVIRNTNILFNQAKGEKIIEFDLSIYLNSLKDKVITYEQSLDDSTEPFKDLDMFQFKELSNHLYSFPHMDIFNFFGQIRPLISKKSLLLYISTYLETLYKNITDINDILLILGNSTDDKVKELYYYHILSSKDNLNDVSKYNDEYLAALINLIENNDRYDVFFAIENKEIYLLIEKYIKKSNQNSKILRHLFSLKDSPTIQKLILLETIIDKDLIISFLRNFEINNPTLEILIYLANNYNYKVNFNSLEISNNQIKEYFNELKDKFTNDMVTYLENIILNRNTFVYLKKNEALDWLLKFDDNYDFNIKPTIFNQAIINNLTTDEYSLVLSNEGLPIKIKELHDITNDLSDEVLHNYDLITLIRLDKVENKDRIYFYNNKDLVFTAIMNHTTNTFLIDEVINTTYNHNKILEILLNKPVSSKSNDHYLSMQENIFNIRKSNKESASKKESLRLVKELSKELLTKVDVVLNTKVEMVPIISFDDIKFNLNNYTVIHDHFTVGFKLGTTQMYFIKNINIFLTNLYNKHFHKYGKQLAFDHNIKSFSQEAKKIISIAERFVDFDNYKNNVGVVLNDYKVLELMELLKNNTIILYNFNGNTDYQEYYINPIFYEVTGNISDEDIAINLVDEVKDASNRLVITKTFDMLVNMKLKTISLINYKSEQLRVLTQFLIKNNTFNGKYVIEELIKDIVPFVKEDLEISDYIKEELENYSFTVDSYFDYDEDLDKITLEKKYYEGNLEISSDKLVKHQLYVDNYETIIGSFHFEENEILEQDHIINFLNADLSPIKRLGKIFVSNKIKSMQVKSVGRISVNVSLDQNVLRTHIHAADFSNEDLVKVLDAYKRGKKYLILNDNVILTDDDNIKEIANFLTVNEFSFKTLETGYEKPVYEVFKFENTDNIDLNIEDEIKVIIDDILNYKDATITNKPHMYDVMMSYQQEGFKWLKTLSKHNLGGILADDMGLGKTLQVISFLESEDFNLSVVVCPKSLTYNWQNELKKFGANIDSLIYSGSKQERLDLIENIKLIDKKTLIITSYDTLRNDIDDFKDIFFEHIILDEAQNIKTVNAQRTRAVKQINANKRFVLTGTPIENSIYDLWSIFDFIMPGYLYTYHKFTNIGAKVHEQDSEMLNFLIKKIQPFILRRVKKDVLTQLPEKVEEVIYATFDGQNRTMYDAYLKETQDRLLDFKSNGLEVLKDLMRLRQLCISPKLVYEDYKDESLKIEVATNLIQGAISSGHKVLVFSSFVQALNIVKSNFSDNESFLLTGNTKAEDRIAMANKFNLEDSEQKVFFISLKAGGTGLNLVGADIVVHLDPWWNIAVENQASDRAHRIGQQNAVTVYKIVMKDSIEEKIIELQNKKKDLFDKMIDHDEEFDKMTLEDYQFILS